MVPTIDHVRAIRWKDGEFCTPHGCSYDKDGNIYITEWLAPIGRVTKLTKIA